LGLGLKIEREKMQTFKNKVRDYYKHYYKNGDEAHLINHADDVCSLALEINKEEDDKLVILASYLHDMFNADNRAIHNELAYEYVLEANDEFLQNLKSEELKRVAHAVLEHRASFKGEYYSSLSEIISSADRGLPDLESVVVRSMRFNNGDAQDVYEHILDKYGTKGYAKYPKVYQEIFKEQLKEFQNEADKIRVEEIEMIWERSK